MLAAIYAPIHFNHVKFDRIIGILLGISLSLGIAASAIHSSQTNKYPSQTNRIAPKR